MQTESVIYLSILCFILAYTLIKPWLSKDKSQIWSPITMIALTYLYYVVKPSFDDLSRYGANHCTNQSLYYLASLIFFVCVLIAFRKTSTGEFSKWNTYFNTNNVQKIALLLFIIALACYIPFRGFRYTISASDATITAERTGLVSYFIDLISLLIGASCLAFIGMKDSIGLGFKKKIVTYVILYFTLVLFIVGGFRYRLVMLLLSLATMYHLYPVPRKINYKLFLPIAICAYLLFAIMDTTRTYGKGLDLQAVSQISLKDASVGAGESSDVCCFSIATMDYCSRNDYYVGFEPIITAICMPIPRAIFPGKPAGEYLLKANQAIIGNAYEGAAVTVIAESFMAFSWLGVILYGLFMGWFCKKVWLNYINNKDSIGAFLLLALFNGFCYPWISRGYMGGVINEFIYFVVMPFWLTLIIKKFVK